MKTRRSTLIYGGLLTFVSLSWTYLSVHFALPWGWITIGAVTVCLGADRAEDAITRRLNRPKRTRRRAHARPRPERTRA
ncbi:hypothetical protein ACFQ0G_53855 [Streptomyces chiangmaiensis]|uniref:hypothetical protein n=1 Tax=Streptomyces chiangmaiensis TaxID=766497 RepID=UPI0031E79772